MEPQEVGDSEVLQEYYEVRQRLGSGGFAATPQGNNGQALPGEFFDEAAVVGPSAGSLLSDGPFGEVAPTDSSLGGSLDLGQRIAQSSAAAVQVVLQPQPKSEATKSGAAFLPQTTGGQANVSGSPGRTPAGAELLSTSAALGLPAGLAGTPTLTYPLRAPKSRASAALLNRLLDDTLGRLRLTSSQPAFRQEGPTLQGSQARHDGGPLLQTGLQLTIPDKADITADNTSKTRSSGGLGDSPGKSNDSATGAHATFDKALSGLLDQAYAKAKCLVDYIHMYSGVDDADTPEGGGEDAAPQGGKKSSGLGGGVGSSAAAPAVTGGVPSPKNPVLTMREQLTQCRTALAQTETALAETTEAARKVLRGSKQKRAALAQECLKLKAEATAAAEALAAEKADRAREAAEVAAQQQAAREAALALEEELAEAAREREEAGIPPPLTLEESAAEITRLEAAIVVLKAKMADNEGHLLGVIEEKRRDVAALNGELSALDDSARERDKNAKAARREVEQTLASELEAKHFVEQELTVAQATVSPDSWFWEGHPGRDGIAFIANRAARATLASPLHLEQLLTAHGLSSAKFKSMSADQKEAWESRVTSQLVRDATTHLSAAHGRATADRAHARRLALCGPLEGLVRFHAWKGHSHAHGPAPFPSSSPSGGVSGGALPLPVALETIYALLDAKLKHDRNDMLVRHTPSTKLATLVDFAEQFFLQQHHLPSLTHQRMRAMLLAIVQHAKLHGKDQRHVLRALVQEIKKKNSSSNGTDSSSGIGGGALVSSGENGNSTGAAAAADDSASVEGDASLREEDEDQDNDDDGDDDSVLSGAAAALSRRKRPSAYPTLLTAHVSFNNFTTAAPPSPSSVGKDLQSIALAPVVEPEVTGQLRLLARLQVFCRLLQLDAPRNYTPRFAALVNAVLTRCFSGAPLKQCMGKVTPMNASSADDDNSTHDSKHKSNAHNKSKSSHSSSGSRPKGKGASSAPSSSNNDAAAKDVTTDEWTLNEPVLVPRRDVVGGLLLSALPPEEEGGGSSHGGGMMMSPTNAGRAGGKGKPLVSAIWLELQKSDAGHRASSPTAAASGSASGGDNAHKDLPACPPLPAVYSEPSHWRSPLLTEFAPPAAIQRLVAAVGALHAVPWQPHAPSSPHGGASSSNSSSGSTGSFDTHGSPNNHHHNNNQSHGHMTFKRVREGWQPGEPMVDLDQFLELFARWCHDEAEARITELENIFNRAVVGATAGGGESNAGSSGNAGNGGGSSSGGGSGGGGDGKLQYAEYRNVMTALNSYIARSSGAGASPGSGSGSPGGASSPHAANAGAAAPDPDANAPVPEEEFMPRYQALHQINVPGGDFLVDAEAFAISLFRENHFTALGDSSAPATANPRQSTP